MNRAIVTPMPGTTRDTLEETLNLRGMPLVLIETAASTTRRRISSSSWVSNGASRRSRKRYRSVGHRCEQSVQDADRTIAGLIPQRPVVMVLNKADLP